MLSQALSFYLPKISFYTKGKKNPLYKNPEVFEEVRNQFKGKVKDEDLEKTVEAGISLVSCFAPKCNNQEKIIAMSKFVTFGYSFDDTDLEKLGETKNYDVTLVDNLMQAIMGKKRPESNIEKELCLIYSELRNTSFEKPYRRHLIGFQTWAESMLEEAEVQKGVSMSLEQFLEFRKHNGGYFGMTSIIECLLDIDISPIWSLVQPIYDEVYLHMMLVNDIYSFRKEYFSNDHTNIIMHLMACHKFSMQSAVNKVIDLLNIQTHKIKKMITKCLIKLEIDQINFDLATKYFRALEDMAAGNILHSQSAKRYHGEDISSPIQSGFIILDPKKTIIEFC